MNSGTDLAGRVHHYDEGTAEDARNGRNVADEIEIEFVVERRVGRLRRTDNEQRVSVCGRAHDRLGADIGSGTRPVLDDKRLAEPLQEPSTDQACHDVEGAAWGSGNDDAHGPRRIGLRPSGPRESRQRGSAGGQMQKLPPAGKFHFGPPFTSFDHLVVTAGHPPFAGRSVTEYWPDDHSGLMLAARITLAHLSI
jgi:hypothetical protein